MPNTVRLQTMLLEKEVSPEDFNITVDNILFGFCDYSMMIKLLEICGDKDLQFDLSPYGYEEYLVSRSSYKSDVGYRNAERLKKLKKAKAILAAKDSGILTFRSTNGSLSAVAEKTDIGEILLRIFNRMGKQLASVLIGKLTVLEDESYEPQKVILKYIGEFVRKPEVFYESIERLDRRGQLLQLDFHCYAANDNPQEFLNFFLSEISSTTICSREISNESRSLLGGIGVGFHPEKVEAIVSDEYPSGSARKRG